MNKDSSLASYINKIKFIVVAILIVLFNVRNYYLLNLEPSGYSVNIYQQVGYDLIYLTIAVCWLGILVLFLFSRDRYNSLIITLLALLLIGNFISFIYFPKMLGYYIADRGDTFSTIGYLRTILQSGHIDPTDIYPMLGIYTASLIKVSKISSSIAIWTMIGLINLVMVIGVYLLSVRAANTNEDNTSRKNVIPLGVALALVYWVNYYHATFIAQFFAFSLEILFLYFILHHNYIASPNKTIVIIILLTFFVFAHPFVAGFNIVLLAMLFVKESISHKQPSHAQKYILMYYSTLLAVWTIYNHQLLNNIAYLPSFIKGFYIIRQIEVMSERATLPLTTLLKYTMTRYWAQALLYLVTLSMILGVIYQRKKIVFIFKKDEVKIAIIGIMYTTFLLLMKHGYDRILGLNFMLFGFIPLFSFLLNHTLSKPNSKIWISVKTIILGSLVFSIFGVFSSPYIGFPFSGITNNEMVGVEFTFEHINPEYKIVDPITEAARYGIWYYRYLNSFRENTILYMYRLPDHFGYTNVAYFSQNKYLLKMEHNVFIPSKVPYNYHKLLVPVTTYAIEQYEKVLPFKLVNRFNYEDIERLRLDPTVNLIYSGSNFELYQTP